MYGRGRRRCCGAIGIECGSSHGELAIGTGTYFFRVHARGAEARLIALELFAGALKIRARHLELVPRILTFFLYALDLLLTALKRRLGTLEFVMRMLPVGLCTLELFVTTAKRCLDTLEFVVYVLPFFLGALKLFVTTVKRCLGTLEFVVCVLSLVLGALEFFLAALNGGLRMLELIVRASKIFLRTCQVRLRGGDVGLHPLEVGLDPRNLTVRPLQIGLHAFAIRLRALPVGLSTFQFRVRAFEVCLRAFPLSLRALKVRLRPRPLGHDRFVQLTARLRGQFGGRLLGLLSDAQGLGDHRALDIGAGGRDFGLEARGPLHADLLELCRPTLFGVSLGVPPRLNDRLFMCLREPSEMRLQLSVQTRANAVDDGTKLILGHSLALSGGRSGKSSTENAASSRPTAT